LWIDREELPFLQLLGQEEDIQFLFQVRVVAKNRDMPHLYAQRDGGPFGAGQMKQVLLYFHGKL